MSLKCPMASKVAKPSLLFDQSCWPDQHAIPSDGSGEEMHFSCIGCLEYYQELGVVDPSSFPVYAWLYGCKPRVSQYSFILS
jgi:hypothetical protein